MTQTISKPSTSIRFDDTRVSIPIYVGVSNQMAKQILEVLRRKVTVASRSSTLGSISVQEATVPVAQREMESRLRVDLQTLRHCLFGSLSQGLSLDLALRVQAELGDELVFIDNDKLKQAFDNSLNTYSHFANTDLNDA